MKTILAICLIVLSGIAFADPPSIYSGDGKYLGDLSSDKYAPNSVSNPYGQYGSKYSPDSINNPYGRYGSKYSNDSPNNPYATTPPAIIHNDRRSK